MYNLINTHIQDVLQEITQNDCNNYEYLIQNIQLVGTPEYQQTYKNYWRLNVARPSPAFCQAYFQLLQNLNEHLLNLDLQAITNQLYNIPTHANGRQSIQFSFSTKLLHTLNPETPIYDSMVAAFFFFVEPNRNNPIQQRIDTFVAFHNFLVGEYARVLEFNLLAPSIQLFRQRFNPQNFTDERIIDYLIWSFVKHAQRRWAN